MKNKIIDSLLLLTGPFIMGVSDTWLIMLPVFLPGSFIAFVNILLVLVGGVFTVLFGVPAAFRLFPKIKVSK
jgi:hypothetical protein